MVDVKISIALIEASKRVIGFRQSALVGVNYWRETRNNASASGATVCRPSGVRVLVDAYGIAASLF
jgi:hypothetical protein